MSRFVTLIYGFAVYLFFFATFVYTIGFVAGVPYVKTIDDGVAGDAWSAILIDLGLLALFAVQHSVMARRSFKDWWTTIVSPTVERSTYVLAASLVIAHLVWQWRPIPDVVWSVQSETARVVLIAVAVAGWIVLFVSTFLIDHFELFGLRQVIAHFRRRALDRPAFRTPGLYRLVRHPIYLGFMLGFWVTPRMTVGHLLFAIMATGYIFVGILFEERDLVVQFGDRYRRYRSEVGMLLPRLATLRAQPTTRRAER